MLYYWKYYLKLIIFENIIILPYKQIFVPFVILSTLKCLVRTTKKRWNFAYAIVMKLFEIFCCMCFHQNDKWSECFRPQLSVIKLQVIKIFLYTCSICNIYYVYISYNNKIQIILCCIFEYEYIIVYYFNL